MSEHHERAATWTDTSRAVAFSDGVFSIIITVLVLDLRPPQAPPGRLLYGLIAQWPTYLAYVTSYAYVAVVWLNHKATFMRVRWMDRALQWANLGILFTTALLPFPTAVVSEVMPKHNALDTRVAVSFYAAVGVVLCSAWVVFFNYLRRHPELLNENIDERFFDGETKRAMAGVILYAAAAVLGYFIAPPLALLIFLALAIFYGVTSHGLYLMQRRGRAGK
jgi:uncharacterized membrane protein